MKIIDGLIQGSEEWKNYRLYHNNASEAAAMLGLDPNFSRDELLKLKRFWIEKDVSDYVREVVFGKGHETEALARPIAEELIGEDLYPIVCEDGKLSCSCDGLTLDESVAWEHKQWNESLAESVRNGILPDFYQPQCQQILLITGAEKLVFMVSDGTDNNLEAIDIYPDQEWFNRIKSGWNQFEKDLESYEYQEVIEPPKAAPSAELPAVTVQVRGELTLCNMAQVRPHFDRFLSEAITEMETDEDFALAEEQAKRGRDTAKKCKLTAKSVVDQMASVSDVVRELEDYAAKFDALALQQEKAVKQQKEARKAMAKQEREKAYRAHVAALEAEIQPIRLQLNGPDFIGAMKNQRRLDSLYNKLDTELANAKIEADAAAKDIREKLSWFMKNATPYRFLFMDLQSIIYESTAGFQAIINQRIEAHKAEEQRKLEAERERIRKEEEQKAKADAERKLKDAERNASDESKPVCVSKPAETETQNDLRSIAETQTEVQEPEHIDHLVPDEPQLDYEWNPNHDDTTLLIRQWIGFCEGNGIILFKIGKAPNSVGKATIERLIAEFKSIA